MNDHLDDPSQDPTAQIDEKPAVKNDATKASRLDSRSTVKLPHRVLEVIRDQQIAGERLVGWFQLTVVVLFGLLYTAAPKTFSPETPFEPVPWVLGAYLILTVMRLILAYRKTLSLPLLFISIIIDISVLLGMIWTFHLQYRQPPAFYLNAPTLLYIFIFISLRALRFEARYVIVSGLCAAVGWIGMAVYAIVAGGGQEAITKDYVTYLTANKVLIGGELDKVLTILTVTAILAVAITRARNLLVRAVTQSTAAQDLSRFFAPEIARQITAAEEQVRAGQGQERHAAILNTDIRGFTRIAATIEPDELMAILAEYQARLAPIIRQHGGAIDKFMGDGIMATFGAVVQTETFAADALRSVDDIMRATTAWQEECRNRNWPPLRIGAAVATGRIVFGAVGDQTRLEVTVIGDAVNTSAKLEKHSKVENVRALCAKSTYNEALEQGYIPPAEHRILSGRDIEGMADPLDIVVIAENSKI
jgi:adenylate cyclase